MVIEKRHHIFESQIQKLNVEISRHRRKIADEIKKAGKKKTKKKKKKKKKNEGGKDRDEKKKEIKSRERK